MQLHHMVQLDFLAPVDISVSFLVNLFGQVWIGPASMVTRHVDKRVSLIPAREILIRSRLDWSQVSHHEVDYASDAIFAVYHGKSQIGSKYLGRWNEYSRLSVNRSLTPR